MSERKQEHPGYRQDCPWEAVGNEGLKNKHMFGEQNNFIQKQELRWFEKGVSNMVLELCKSSS